VAFAFKNRKRSLIHCKILKMQNSKMLDVYLYVQKVHDMKIVPLLDSADKLSVEMMVGLQTIFSMNHAVLVQELSIYSEA
jgi:uncharacterized protein YcgL (UPF0745 family)